MPYTTEVSYTGNGTNVNFTVPFPYLEADDVLVTLNDTPTTAFSWITDTSIQFTTAPANGVHIRIYRVTDIDEPKVDYADGSTVSEKDLDTSCRQEIFALQEALTRIAALEALITSIQVTAGNLPAVDSSKNGYVLQVVSGAWTLVPTTSVTYLTNYQVDGTTLKFQKKTQTGKVVGTPGAESAWTDVHTGHDCDA